MNRLISRATILTVTCLSACASTPQEPKLVGGRCMAPDADGMMAAFEAEAGVETALLGAEVRPGFREYETLKVPRGEVLVERAPGEFCTGREVRFFPGLLTSGLNGGGLGVVIRNPALPGEAFVCFRDEDDDGRFETATAYDSTYGAGENAEPMTKKLDPRPSYAKVACGT